MSWVTTNIRLPEDIYMELRIEAAKKRTSIASLIRDQLTKKMVKKSSKGEVDKFMRRLNRVAKAIAKENKGINFTKGLIEMRYEQQ